MPRYAGKMALSRPSAVAVHYDCDVLWKPRRIKPLVYLGFFLIQPGRNCCLQGKSFRFRN
jgi:hypothetical protein